MAARTIKPAPEEKGQDIEQETTPAQEVETLNQVPNVAVAMSEAMHYVRSVQKDGVNTFQNFKFRGIDAVMNAVGPALRKAHVVIVPSRIISHDMQTAQTSQNKTTNAVRVHVEYTIYGPAGDSIKMEAVGEAQDSADKGTAKAMSVAYRTLLLQAFTLPTDDPDPDQEDTVPYTRGQGARGDEPKASRPQWDQATVNGGIMAANGNLEALQAFYKEAEANGCPPQGLGMIRKAGEALRASYASQGQPKPEPTQEEARTNLERLKQSGAVQTGADVWGGSVPDEKPAALDTSLDPTAPDPNDPIDTDAEAAWLAQNGG